MQLHQLWMPLIQQNRLKTVWIILLGFISNYCTLLLPLSIGTFMEIVFHSGGGKSRALQLLGIYIQNSLPVFFAFFSSMLLLKLLSNWGFRFLSTTLGEAFTAFLRQRLFKRHLLEMNDTLLKPAVLLPFSNDVKFMQRYLVKGVIGFTKDILFLLMALYVLAALQPLLTAVVLTLCILFYIFSRWLNRYNKPFAMQKRKRQAQLLHFVSGILLQQSVVISTESALLGFDNKIKKMQHDSRQYYLLKTFLSAFTPFLLYLMVAILLAVLAWGKNFMHLPGPNEAVVYILLLMMIFPVFKGLFTVEAVWMEGRLSAQKFLVLPQKNREYVAGDTGNP
jgi:ABC-type multidrug transport system fused ATPase/permease subunit